MFVWDQRRKRRYGSARLLCPEFPHSSVAGTSYVRRVGVRQVGTTFHQQLDPGGYCILLVLGQVAPPLPKLVRVLNLPSHYPIIFLIGNHGKAQEGNYQVIGLWGTEWLTLRPSVQAVGRGVLTPAVLHSWPRALPCTKPPVAAGGRGR